MKYYFLPLIILMLFACSTEDAKKIKPNIQQTKKEIAKNNKSSKSAKLTYEQKLVRSLKVKNPKKKQVILLYKDYRSKIQKEKKNRKKVLQLKKERDQKIKQILGPSLFSKKLKFDKTLKK